MSKQTKAKPQADPLSGKLRPRRLYRMQVAEPTIEQQQALGDAQYELRMALVSDDGERRRAAREQRAAAQAAVDGCWQTIVLHNVPGNRFRELIAEHQPTEEQAEAGAEWNPDTFQPALIAECAIDLGMTAEQWAAELSSERWSIAERNDLFHLALDVNVTGGYR